ncbi:MAG: protein kinase, partial [Bdellovibrionales bacterium]|nr:protein kinase [Bdellovibrionales bacterium]
MAQANKTKKIFDGRYEIIGIVGRGSQSVVYHARHALVPSTEVALKVLIDTGKKSSNKQSIHDKLRKEALCMVSARHRYVVRIDDFHSIDNLCYLSLEYAPHADLRKFLAKLGKPLSPAQAVRFLEQAAEALAFIHKTGMIHRDIKPDNILVMSEKEIRIGDFGVAVLPGEQSSIDELKRGVGTMDYMAPEVLDGTEYTAASDIYALGISFFEMITGKHPFTNGSMASQLSAREDSQIKRLSEVIPNVPGRLDDAIFEAMRSNSSDRIKNGSELLSLLRKGSDQPRAKSESPRAPFAEKPEHPPGSSSTKVPPQESPRAPSKQASPISQKPPGEPTSPKPSPINQNKPPRPQIPPPSTEKSKGDQGAAPASSTSAASILKRLEAIKKEAEMRRGAKPGKSDASSSDTTKPSGLNFKDSPKDTGSPTPPQPQVPPPRATPKP